MIVAQNKAKSEIIDVAKAAATTSNEKKMNKAFRERMRASDESLNTLENDSKRKKGKKNEFNKAKMKNELAIADAIYISENTHSD